jgi:hypothetical protein
MAFPIKPILLALAVCCCSTEKEEKIIYVDETTQLPTNSPKPNPAKHINADLIFFAGSNWKLVNVFEDNIIEETPTYIFNSRTYKLAMIFDKGSLTKVFIKASAETLRTISQSLVDVERISYIYYSAR